MAEFMVTSDGTELSKDQHHQESPKTMKVLVDRQLCSSYGICVQTVPAVFSFDDDNDLIVSEVPAELEQRVSTACQQCPTGALRLEE